MRFFAGDQPAGQRSRATPNLRVIEQTFGQSRLNGIRTPMLITWFLFSKVSGVDGLLMPLSGRGAVPPLTSPKS